MKAGNITQKHRFKLEIPVGKGRYAVFSLPTNNQYQFIDDIKIEPNCFKNIITSKERNRVVVFTLNDVEKKIIIKFNTKTQTYKKTVDERFSLDDYEKIKIPEADRFVNGADAQIKTIVRKIINHEKNIKAIFTSLYQFILRYLTYGQPIDGLHTYKQALEEKVTDCGGFSTLLMSLLHSLNIPSHLVVGFIIKDNFLAEIFFPLTFNSLLMHVWVEAMLPDKSWFPLDPAIEWRRRKGLTQRQGGFGYIPADRLVVSYGQNFTININNRKYQIELLQKPAYI